MKTFTAMRCDLNDNSWSSYSFKALDRHNALNVVNELNKGACEFEFKGRRYPVGSGKPTHLYLIAD